MVYIQLSIVSDFFNLSVSQLIIACTLSVSLFAQKINISTRVFTTLNEYMSGLDRTLSSDDMKMGIMEVWLFDFCLITLNFCQIFLPTLAIMIICCSESR